MWRHYSKLDPLEDFVDLVVATVEVVRVGPLPPYCAEPYWNPFSKPH